MPMTAIARGTLVATLVVAGSASALAQEPKSAALAKQLAAALDAAKLDSLAAKDPSSPDTYVGVLYIPGFQLLTVGAKYSAPQLIDAKIEKKEYRDVYIDLQSSASPGSKFFVEDMGLDGLRAKRDNDQPFDSVEINGKRTMFDGDWRKQQLTEQDYTKAHTAADEHYTQLLTALLAQLKK
jgi:hypothetical protein